VDEVVVPKCHVTCGFLYEVVSPLCLIIYNFM